MKNKIIRYADSLYSPGDSGFDHEFLSTIEKFVECQHEGENRLSNFSNQRVMLASYFVIVHLKVEHKVRGKWYSAFTR